VGKGIVFIALHHLGNEIVFTAPWRSLLENKWQKIIVTGADAEVPHAPKSGRRIANSAQRHSSVMHFADFEA
jgi:hypothetical protein